MTATPSPLPAARSREPSPELSFSVEDALPTRYAAAPTIGFQVAIQRSAGGPIRSIMLTAQVRIAATRRAYGEAERERLSELFGPSGDWGRNIHSLLWANATVLVPPFSDRTTVEVAVPCTYDLEVGFAKYLNALTEGVVPVEFLFAGTVFYGDEQGHLRTTLIPWTAEASYPLPVRVWRKAMDRHFPDTAWLRLRREVFDRLAAYRARHVLGSWEEALERLLAAEEGVE